MAQGEATPTEARRPFPVAAWNGIVVGIRGRDKFIWLGLLFIVAAFFLGSTIRSAREEARIEAEYRAYVEAEQRRAAEQRAAQEAAAKARAEAEERAKAEALRRTWEIVPTAKTAWTTNAEVAVYAGESGTEPKVTTTKLPPRTQVQVTGLTRNGRFYEVAPVRGMTMPSPALLCEQCVTFLDPSRESTSSGRTATPPQPSRATTPGTTRDGIPPPSPGVPAVTTQELAGASQPSSPGATTAGGAPRDLFATWSGTYTCQQGLTSVTVVLQGAGSIIEGTFSFDANGVKGSFKAGAQYEVSSRKLKLWPLTWIERPAGYTSAGFTATVDQQVRSMTGQIDHPGCGAVNLRRN
jgi:hypothetical protein